MIFNHGYSLNLDTSRCLNQWHEGANCTHCIRNCPTDAIQLNRGQISIEGSLCHGCGLCLSDCPTGVFSSNQWDETTVINLVKKEKWKVTEFFCAAHKSPYKQDKNQERGAVQLPACLSIVSKGGWYELGMYTSLELHCEECEDCPMAETFTRLDYNIRTAAEWLSSSGREHSFSYIYQSIMGKAKKNLKALETGLKVSSRRELFVTLLDHGRNQLMNRINEITGSSPSNRKPSQLRPGSCLPEWRKRLAAVFPKNQESVESPAYWPEIQIDDNCVKCGMCSRFCPAGALEMKFENGTVTHYFTSGLCLDCRTCQLFCPQQAISRGREQNENPFETIAVVSKRAKVCKICGTPTNEDSKDMCFMCEKERTHENQLINTCKELFLTK